MGGPAEAPPGAEEEEEEEEEEEMGPNRQTRRTANPPQKLLSSPAPQNNRCCTLQKQTLRPTREIFQLKFTNVSNLCSWDILRLVNKQIIFPFVRFDFTQSPYLMGCFPKLNKDGNSA